MRSLKRDGPSIGWLALVFCVTSLFALFSFLSLGVHPKDAVAIGLLVLYYFVLWQIDHCCAAPAIWNTEAKNWMVDAWIMEMNITDVYNTLMLGLLFCPLLVFFFLAL